MNPPTEKEKVRDIAPLLEARRKITEKIVDTNYEYRNRDGKMKLLYEERDKLEALIEKFIYD